MKTIANKVALVTGSNRGIGFAVVKGLAEQGITVVLTSRNEKDGRTALDQLDDPNVYYHPLDVTASGSVQKLVDYVTRTFGRLDILINNAGIMNPPYGKTVQGFETQFGVNHLGHFVLAALVIDLLVQTPGSRVVSVSSVMHRRGSIRFDDLNWERGYRRGAAYGQSKLANLLFTYELQRRLAGAGRETIAVAAHPGWTETNLQGYTPSFKMMNRFFAQEPLMGALPTLYAATDPAVNGAEYFGPDGLAEMTGHPKRVRSNRRSHDRDAAERLWRVSEQMTGTDFRVPEASA